MTDAKHLADSLETEDIVDLCRQLVRIESVNPPGDELRIAEFAAVILLDAGFKVEIIHHSPTRASVLAVLPGSGGVRPLLCAGHFDTVPAGTVKWRRDPFAADVAEGKIWGRGTSDMKGGLAALIIAAKTLARSRMPLRGDLILALTAGEEVDSLGAVSIAARTDLGPVQAVIIPEPSGNDIYIAEKGALWLELTTHGRTAHGAMPELGENAILMMVDLIAELKKIPVPFAGHPLLGGFSMSINTIQGGLKTNVVPDRCVVTLDMRTVPGQRHDEIVGGVKEIIAVMGRKNPVFKASIEVINDRLPVETAPDEPAVLKFVDVAAVFLGERPVPKGVKYYTDATVLVPAFKAPMIICGPGDPGQGHQPNEWVEIEKIVTCARIYVAAAAEFLM